MFWFHLLCLGILIGYICSYWVKLAYIFKNQQKKKTLQPCNSDAYWAVFLSLLVLRNLLSPLPFFTTEALAVTVDVPCFTAVLDLNLRNISFQKQHLAGCLTPWLACLLAFWLGSLLAAGKLAKSLWEVCVCRVPWCCLPLFPSSEFSAVPFDFAVLSSNTSSCNPALGHHSSIFW